MPSAARKDFEERKKRLSIPATTATPSLARQDFEERKARLAFSRFAEAAGKMPESKEEYEPLNFLDLLGAGRRGVLETVASGMAGELPSIDPILKESATRREPAHAIVAALNPFRLGQERDGIIPKDISDAGPIETAAGVALDLAADPINYIPIGKIAKILYGGGRALRGIERGGTKLVGAIAEPLTVGRITKKGMGHAAKDFSPAEQIFAKRTLKKAKETYGPLKEATDEILVGMKSLADAPYEVAPVQIDDDLLGAMRNLDIQYKKLQRMKSDVTKIGEVPDVDVGSDILRALKGKIDAIKAKQGGYITAPQATEMRDMLNQLEYTPIGNPRAVPGNFKAAYDRLASKLAGATEKSAPELEAGRKGFHAAAEMNVGRAGGKMTEMLQQRDLNEAMRVATQSLISNDAGKIAQALMIIGKSAPAINALTGIVRLIPRSAAVSLESTAKYIAAHPEVGRAMVAALSQGVNELGREDIALGNGGFLPEYEAGKAQAAMNQMTPGLPGPNETPLPTQNFSPTPAPTSAPIPQAPPALPMATPTPAPIDPKDQALMDLTGLTSVMGGKIQDPAERQRFVEDVEGNPNLTPRQKMVIQIRARRDGTVTLPQDVP